MIATTEPTRRSRGAQPGNQNSLRHGLTSKHRVLLDHEDDNEYDLLLQSYFELFRPRNERERDLAAALADERWKIRRAKRMERAAIDSCIELYEGDVGAAALDPNLVRALNSYSRHANAANLAYKRAYQALQELRKEYDELLARARAEAEAMRKHREAAAAEEKITKRIEDDATAPADETRKITKRIAPSQVPPLPPGARQQSTSSEHTNHRGHPDRRAILLTA